MRLRKQDVIAGFGMICEVAWSLALTASLSIGSAGVLALPLVAVYVFSWISRAQNVRNRPLILWTFAANWLLLVVAIVAVHHDPYFSLNPLAFHRSGVGILLRFSLLAISVAALIRIAAVVTGRLLQGDQSHASTNP